MHKNSHLAQLWPYFSILIITSLYFLYIIQEGFFFAWDDFTALTFVAERSYLQVIIDSLASRSVDRHKFIGYLLHKLLFDTIGLRINSYFLVMFILHTSNCFLIFKLLNRFVKNKYISTFVTLVYAYRFYFWWWSNSHVYLETFFGLLFTHRWLDYLCNHKKIHVIILWLLWPLMVFSYGPAVLLPLALVPFTFYYQKFSFRQIIPLIPFIALFVIYFVTFIFTPDTMDRFNSNNPYHPIFTLPTLIHTQSVYLYELSAHLLPQSSIVVYLFWSILIGLSVIKPKLFFLPLSFLIAISANSFFPEHTIFYYLTLPIIFLLIYFADLLSQRSRLLPFVIFFILFCPFRGIRPIITRIHHGGSCFECQSVIKINTAISQAIQKGETQIQSSNWDITPSLNHAITYQAINYFLTHPRKDDYLYSYSRDTQVLTLTTKDSKVY